MNTTPTPEEAAARSLMHRTSWLGGPVQTICQLRVIADGIWAFGEFQLTLPEARQALASGSHRHWPQLPECPVCWEDRPALELVAVS